MADARSPSSGITCVDSYTNQDVVQVKGQAESSAVDSGSPDRAEPMEVDSKIQSVDLTDQDKCSQPDNETETPKPGSPVVSIQGSVCTYVTTNCVVDEAGGSKLDTHHTSPDNCTVPSILLPESIQVQADKYSEPDSTVVTVSDPMCTEDGSEPCGDAEKDPTAEAEPQVAMEITDPVFEEQTPSETKPVDEDQTLSDTMDQNVNSQETVKGESSVIDKSDNVISPDHEPSEVTMVTMETPGEKDISSPMHGFHITSAKVECPNEDVAMNVEDAESCALSPISYLPTTVPSEKLADVLPKVQDIAVSLGCGKVSDCDESMDIVKQTTTHSNTESSPDVISCSKSLSVPLLDNCDQSCTTEVQEPTDLPPQTGSRAERVSVSSDTWVTPVSASSIPKKVVPILGDVPSNPVVTSLKNDLLSLPENCLSTVEEVPSVSMDGQSILVNGLSMPEDKPSMVEENPSMVEDKPSVVEEKTPMVEDKPSMVEEKTPMVEDKPSMVEEKTPMVEDKPSVVEEKTPMVEEKPPMVEDKPSMVEEKTPMVEDKPSMVEEKPPMVEDKPSEVEDMPSMVEDMPSMVEDKPSMVEEKPPMVEDKPSMVEDKPSMVEEKTPMVEDKPSMVEDMPSMVEDMPSMVEDKPSVVEDKPSMVKDKPSMVEEKTPMVEDKPSMVEDMPSMVEDKPSMVDDMPSIPGDKQSMVEDEPSIPEDEPSMVEDGQSISENKPSIMNDGPSVAEVPSIPMDVPDNEPSIAEVISIVEDEPSIPDSGPSKLEDVSSIPELGPSILEDVPSILEHGPSKLEDVPSVQEHGPSKLEDFPSTQEHWPSFVEKVLLLPEDIPVSEDLGCLTKESHVASPFQQQISMPNELVKNTSRVLCEDNSDKQTDVSDGDTAITVQDNDTGVCQSDPSKIISESHPSEEEKNNSNHGVSELSTENQLNNNPEVKVTLPDIVSSKDLHCRNETFTVTEMSSPKASDKEQIVCQSQQHSEDLTQTDKAAEVQISKAEGMQCQDCSVHPSLTSEESVSMMRGDTNEDSGSETNRTSTIDAQTVFPAQKSPQLEVLPEQHGAPRSGVTETSSSMDTTELPTQPTTQSGENIMKESEKTETFNLGSRITEQFNPESETDSNVTSEIQRKKVFESEIQNKEMFVSDSRQEDSFTFGSFASESNSMDTNFTQNSAEISNSLDSSVVSNSQERVPPLRLTLREGYPSIAMDDSESSNSSCGSASTGTTLPLDLNDIPKMESELGDELPKDDSSGLGDKTGSKDGADTLGQKNTEKTESGTNISYNTDNIPVEFEEPDFEWEEYLEDTNSVSAPDNAFPHVEVSLRSNFEKGMKFEVGVTSDEPKYWLCTVVMPCGQLLRLRYDGLESDGSKDFWCDAFKSDIHPLGWSRQNGKTLEPPNDVKEKLPDWEDYVQTTLQQAPTASAQLLGGGLGTAAVDQIKQGMILEVQHELDHTRVWIARVLENIGGRLLLRYEGTDSAAQDFWLFYLHFRLHPMGWASEMDMEYGPPEAVAEEWSRDEGWKAVLDKAQADTHNPVFPGEVLADQEMMLDHSFKEGWKLEAIHPINKSKICPATVVQVYSDLYFLVQIDDLDPSPEDMPVQMCCHGGSRNILPINWCQKHGTTIMAPNGWLRPEFQWSDYLSEVQAEAAPEDCFSTDYGEIHLEKGMKLESSSPDQPGQICVATVTQVIKPLVFIHLESSSFLKSAHIVDCQSQEVFPVGWCESNNYPLKPPHRLVFTRRPKEQVTTEVIPPTTEKPSETSQSKNPFFDKGSSWCPKIYFNHRCFSGPYLSKGRIAELPKCVGPGPVTLVMKEVLSMLINVAYKSSRVLRELQLDGPADPNLHQQVLKAKYKGKSYRAMVELCKSSDQVVEFCHRVCGILECCPNLFSPTYISGQCPENCNQLSKTKYTYLGKKKKKVGRPPGGHTNLEFGAKKPGKRRKRKRIGLLKIKKSSTSNTLTIVKDEPEEQEPNDQYMFHEDSSNSTVGSLEHTMLEPSRKRKYTRHIAPPHEMKTRGVKLPRYSFERRSRQQRGGLQMNPGRPPKYSPIQQRRLQKQQQQQQEKQQQQKPGIRKSAFEWVKTEQTMVLDTNPLWWTVGEVVEFMHTTDCAALSRLFKEQEIDGQALLLLTLPTVQELMEVKLGPAIKLCHLIERLKIAFFEQFAC